MAEDSERDPVAGADPTRSTAGGAPGAEDPATKSRTAGATDQAPSAPEAPRSTNAGRIWIALALATILLVLLIIFVAENSRSVTISFLGAHGHISLALALLIAAVAGAAVVLLAGTARILQLRWEVRRSRRNGSGRQRRLQPH